MKFDHFPSRLFAASAASLLLHALALFGWGPRPQAPALPRPVMQVVVTAPSPVQAAAAERSAAPTAPATRSLPARQSPPVQAVARRAAEPAGPPPAALVPAAAAVANEVLPIATTAATAPATATTPAAPVAAAPAAASTQDGPSADGLRQYRIELAGAARRFRLYPAVARARGWEGLVEVSVVIDAALPVPAVQLVRSSGHALLDEQALTMLSRAVAGTPLPESLRGRSFVVAVPVRFSLEE